MKTSHNQQGFSAIEAVIVVVVVALLALVAWGVWLHKPVTATKSQQSAGAQNVARRNDVAAIAAGLGNYIANANGAFPTSTATDSTANTLDICGGDCSGNSKSTVLLSHYKNNASAVQLHAYQASLTVPDAETVYIVSNASCNSTETGLNSQQPGSPADYAILYALESGSSTTQACLSS